MTLAAIFNIWSDYDLLEHSVKHITPLVDGVIIVASRYSNYGEFEEIPIEWRDKVHVREPIHKIPMFAETYKRNCGLDIAREQGYTHFLMMDADEFYTPYEFNQAKKLFHVKQDLNGLVCELKCYFKSPTLTIGIEKTLVPFIHKLTPTIKHEFNRDYPFAWEGNDIRIDPTRSLNINSGVEMCDVTMHHMSYVRSDLRRKIRNSTAKKNIENSTLIEDYKNASEGYFCKFYNQPLIKVNNIFNLPEIVDLSIN